MSFSTHTLLKPLLCLLSNPTKPPTTPLISLPTLPGITGRIHKQWKGCGAVARPTCGRQEQCTHRCFNPFPTTTSTHLVGIIQSWVSTGSSLILDGLLVRVSGDSPTAISSLDEGECESGVSGDSGLGQRITQTLHTCALRNLGEEVCSLGGCPLLW